jgi:AraC family transcriptional regulator
LTPEDTLGRLRPWIGPQARQLTGLIEPHELPRWVPGKLLIASAPQAWGGVSLRAYHYQGLDVEVPAMRDFMIVVYQHGLTPMNRRVDAGWRHEDLIPGDVSLLTRAEQSHWCWSEDIEVVHLYLTRALLARVSSEVFEREIEDVRLLDILKSHDPTICRLATALADEARATAMGGQLYVDSIANQLCVHILRNYSTVSFRPRTPRRGLSNAQAQQVRTYVEGHLDRTLSLEELGALLRISPWHFLRQFKLRFGCPPHAFIVRRCIERAKTLMASAGLSLKEIAQRSGFADQSHLTRVFRRFEGTTPRAFRDDEGNL